MTLTFFGVYYEERKLTQTGQNITDIVEEIRVTSPYILTSLHRHKQLKNISLTNTMREVMVAEAHWPVLAIGETG